MKVGQVAIDPKKVLNPGLKKNQICLKFNIISHPVQKWAPCNPSQCQEKWPNQHHCLQVLPKWPLGSERQQRPRAPIKYADPKVLFHDLSEEKSLRRPEPQSREIVKAWFASPGRHPKVAGDRTGSHPADPPKQLEVTKVGSQKAARKAKHGTGKSCPCSAGPPTVTRQKLSKSLGGNHN